MFFSFPKKMLLFFLIAAIVFVFFSAKREINNNKYIYEEMDRLEKQAAELEKEKRDLSDLTAFLATESYVEKEAKKQLGLQNSGEKVIVITKEDGAKTAPTEVIELKKESNFQKWMRFIFKLNE